MADDHSVHSYKNPAFSAIFSLHETRKFKSTVVQQRIHIQEVLVHLILPSGDNFSNDNYDDKLLYASS